MSEKEWNIDDYWSRLMPRRPVDLAGAFQKSKPISRYTEVSDEKLRECYAVMAQVVTMYGDTYLPIFERLHNEIEKRQHRKSMLEKAFDAAGLEL